MSSHYSADTERDQVLRRRAGAYLKVLREEAGLTQLQVSTALGYGYPTQVSQIERGYNRIPPKDMAGYAKVLGKDLAELTRHLLKFYDPLIHQALFGSAPEAEQ